jgi:dihydrofolate synthase/folylpolyglutamate synthase
MMDFSQAEKYVLSFTDYEKIPGFAYTAANYDLRRMEELLRSLDNPHLGRRTVHIAGTKGKGSTAAMVSQALITAGYKTGLYTSPHLHTIRERIRVNGIMISESQFAALVSGMRPCVEVVNKEARYGMLTTFEILTAVAFSHFSRECVDFQVLEVGLGGRLDATNVAHGNVCVITSISLDHMDILGDTVEKIATEKAGIIKPGSIVVCAPQTSEVAEVVVRACAEKGARFVQVGKDITWRKTDGDLSKQSLTVYTPNTSYELVIPLLGDHQLENAATAVGTLEALTSLGVRIPKEAVVRGLREVEWQGRLQILKRRPMLVVDGAHNADSMRRLVVTTRQYFDYEKCIVVFGTSSDKDISGMVRELQPLAAHIIVTSSTHPRAASISTLVKAFSRAGIGVEESRNVSEALSQALDRAQATDLILVTGSLFVVAEALDYAAKHLVAEADRQTQSSTE